MSFARGALTKLIEPLMLDSEITKAQGDENRIKAFKVQWGQISTKGGCNCRNAPHWNVCIENNYMPRSKFCSG